MDSMDRRVRSRNRGGRAGNERLRAVWTKAPEYGPTQYRSGLADAGWICLGVPAAHPAPVRLWSTRTPCAAGFMSAEELFSQFFSGGGMGGMGGRRRYVRHAETGPAGRTTSAHGYARARSQALLAAC
jgi:hypothetical protein